MNPVRASFNWLKFTWATQPVLFLSCVLGGLGEDGQVCGCALSRTITVGPLFVAFGPGSQKGEQERLNWPTHYKSKRSKLGSHFELNRQGLISPWYCTPLASLRLSAFSINMSSTVIDSATII